MNIWLDDQRKAPEGWIHLHNIDEVNEFMQSALKREDFQIETMSFDYHLSHPKRGVDVMKYLAELCQQNSTKRFWPTVVLYHSNDPEGVAIMKSFQKRFEEEILLSVEIPRHTKL